MRRLVIIQINIYMKLGYIKIHNIKKFYIIVKINKLI